MTLPAPYFQDESVTIYHGDCRDILPSLPKVGLVLTDPPYGIDMDTNAYIDCGRVHYESIIGDNIPFNPQFLFKLNSEFILFGANNYHHSLPIGGGWLVWDKRSIDGSSDNVFGWPFELAWCSRDRFGKIYRVQHGGYLNADKMGKRQHPTQKPVALFRQILQDFSNSNTILDPFMGSGTTLRAAKDLGRKAIGIEIEEKYCKIAAKRMAQSVMNMEI